ncbi:MAG: tetratricopeptide repeat protein [Odoribacter sp.]|nr:tetratricopeptide repeat protein [Odoribacter sp.]
MKYQLLIIATILLSACNTKVKQANRKGLEYMKQNHYEQAIAEFTRAITGNAGWFPAYYNRAVSYANIRQYKEALDDFNYILNNFPDQAEAYFNRGITYENLGLYANAIKDYSETIKLRPDFILAYHYRGIARFRMNDLNGALQDYNRALNLGKDIEMDVVKAKEFGLNSSALYFNRGVILQKQGNYQNAIQDYTQAITIDPSSAKAYYNRAIAKMALSQADEALKDLEISSRLGFDQAGNVIRSYFHN